MILLFYKSRQAMGYKTRNTKNTKKRLDRDPVKPKSKERKHFEGFVHKKLRKETVKPRCVIQLYLRKA